MQGTLHFVHIAHFVIPVSVKGIHAYFTKRHEVVLAGLFYGCETWSLTLREEYRRWVFENRVLRRIFWSERDEVTKLKSLFF
jgi:hypothetical protein